MNFSEKIKNYRKQHNLTQEQFADKLAISRQAVSKWESGKGYPDIKTIEILAKLLDTSIDALLSSEETTTLSLSSAQKINSTVKNLLVMVCSLALVLLIFLSIVLSSFFGNSVLDGLVGFYIDVDSTDGNFDPKNPNNVDIYFFKDSNQSGEMLTNGIVENSVHLTQNYDGSAFAQYSAWVYVDATAKGFVIYQIYQKKGILSSVKYGEITQMPLSGDFRETAVLTYTFSDQIEKKDRKIGCSFNLYYTYKNSFNAIKIVEYSDESFLTVSNQQTLTEFSREQYFYLDISTTKSFEVFGLSGTGDNMFQSLLASKSGIPNQYLAEFYFANSYGYIAHVSQLFVTYAKPTPY